MLLEDITEQSAFICSGIHTIRATTEGLSHSAIA